ncbi:hypothetical protein CQW23_28212 [Capsicum baccatum]|uniref:Uncharacterized protein n=1 Tax=Capsicum baccatum TaxID=33114 RepID=A0A2G2VFV5_CAPBA|nr:hypothetical protein CQW23_28212 [Capsicum baccatum]
MKSEFIALDKDGEEAEWLQNFLEDIPYWPKPVAPAHDELDLGANEQNSDQVGSANEQDPNGRDGGTNEQVHDELDLGTNEQNSDQDGDADEQVPNEQDQREILSPDCIHCRICKTQVAFVEDCVPDIAVSQPSWHFREGRFYMRFDKLIYWNNVTLLQFLFGIGGANEQAPDDQAGGADEQDHDQDVGTNEQDHDQDVGANE